MMASLADFRVDGKAPEPKPLIEVLAPKFEGRILAFDQTLGNVGWVYCQAEAAEVRVVRTGHIKTEPGMRGAKGDEDNLQRTVAIYHEVWSIVKEIDPHLIVHESPPAGGRLARPDSALLAAAAVRIVAADADCPVHMVHAQRVKKLLTGNGNAQKRDVAAAVRRAMPGLVERRIKPLNEHVYDAIGLAVVAAEEVSWQPE